MIITLDYNNDSVSIQNEENDPTVISWKKVKDITILQAILYEMFNILDVGEDKTHYVMIQKIDEDIQTVVGEW